IGGNVSVPNLRILFGSPGGFSESTASSLVDLPGGPFGGSNPFPRPPVWSGAEVDPMVVADFSNDGLPGIFGTEHQRLTYQPGVFTDTNDPEYANIRANGGSVPGDSAFQILINQGSRRFLDQTPLSSAQRFGRRYHFALIPIDINNDGFLD